MQKEQVKERFFLYYWRSLFSNFTYAIRVLSRSPGYTAVAVLVLALGIGANSAIFSIVEAVLIRPLPFPSAQRLVALPAVTRGGSVLTSYPDFRDLRDGNHTFRHLIAFHDERWSLMTPDAQAVSLRVGIVSSDLFPMLGISPIRGRVFNKAEDEDIKGPMTVILSASLWHNCFGSDPNIIGRSVTLRGLPYTVVGVMPAGFNFPVGNKVIEAWSTFGFSDYLRSPLPWPRERGTRFLEMAGELQPGVTVQAGQAELTALCDWLARKYPTTNNHRSVKVEPLLSSLTRNQRPVFLLLLGAVGCVLLIACANVANLSLARASKRRRELAVCMALGVGRARLVWLVLTENLVLSALGGCLGLAIGALGTRLLAKLSPVDVPRIGEAHLDLAVLLFTGLLATITGVIVGVVPASRALQISPGDALKSEAAHESVSARNSTRNALLVGEVALSLGLLSCAGLLVVSLQHLTRFRSGFDAKNVLSAQLSFPAAKFTEVNFNQAMEELEVRLRQVPGVVAAGDAAVLPLQGDSINSSFEIRGHPIARSEQPRVRANVIGPGYLETLGVPLLAGRALTRNDAANSPSVVLIDQALARQYFLHSDPVGQQIRTGLAAYSTTERPFRTIVGVVGSVAEDRMGQKTLPEFYLPRQQLPFFYAYLVVKTTGDARSSLPAVAAALHGIAPDIPLDEIHTLQELVTRSLAQARSLGVLLLAFAALALVLTTVGLYGVVAYTVAQRTREIAVRRALGAQTADILWAVLRQGLLLVALGSVIGVAGSLLISRLLGAVLYSVRPADPLILAAAAALIVIVALAAMLVPAWQATRLDPVIGLRYE